MVDIELFFVNFDFFSFDNFVATILSKVVFYCITKIGRSNGCDVIIVFFIWNIEVVFDFLVDNSSLNHRISGIRIDGWTYHTSLPFRFLHLFICFLNFSYVGALIDWFVHSFCALGNLYGQFPA